jgi:hypothetical protein
VLSPAWSGLCPKGSSTPRCSGTSSTAGPDRSRATSTCDYGGPVTASAEQGSLWGTQFHPEKSGEVGLAILANFVAACPDSIGRSTLTA